MRQTARLSALLLCLALACSACGGAPAATAPAPEPSAGQVRAEAERLADAQLGLLAERITGQERGRVLNLMERLVPLRQARLESGAWERSEAEARLAAQLNRLYERFTLKYLGGGAWGYLGPAEQVLAEYRIEDGVSLRPDRGKSAPPEADYQPLWEQMLALLPEGAWADFSRFTVFTDGADETLAYTAPVDAAGARWEIGVDPADAGDGAWFTETVLHEYAHYLTLNDAQAAYGGPPAAATYREEGMAALPGSYLDDFYRAFWADYLDDRLANLDSYGFFLRHEDDFVTDYASTDPAEDIAESFTYFVLSEAQPGDAVWVRKLNFFYDYPELVRFRQETRQRLGLAEEAPAS